MKVNIGIKDIEGKRFRLWTKVYLAGRIDPKSKMLLIYPVEGGNPVLSKGFLTDWPIRCYIPSANFEILK